MFNFRTSAHRLCSRDAMNNHTLSIALAFLVVVVLSWVVLNLATPCDGNYSFELRNGLTFSCTKPPEKGTAREQETPVAAKPPQPAESSPKPPLATPTPSTPPPTAAASSTPLDSLVRCRKIRATKTTKELVTNPAQADDQCKEAVKGLPKDYRKDTKRYVFHGDDRSVSVDTGQKIEGHELWCNCLLE